MPFRHPATGGDIASPPNPSKVQRAQCTLLLPLTDGEPLPSKPVWTPRAPWRPRRWQTASEPEGKYVISTTRGGGLRKKAVWKFVSGFLQRREQHSPGNKREL